MQPVWSSVDVQSAYHAKAMRETVMTPEALQAIGLLVVQIPRGE
jgi:hypothetical protein